MGGLNAVRATGKTPAAQELTEELRRILGSPGFTSSEVLPALLTHLVQSETETPGRHIKEYEIATKVLGRGDDFDPRLDSTVRVHTGRLRTKLTEYYNSGGASDPIRITIPKGAYHVSYEVRGGQPGPASVSEAQPRHRRTAWIAAGALGWLVALASVGLWLSSRSPRPVTSSTVNEFWSAVAREGESAVVVYSNPQFQGSATRGMRYVTPGAKTTPAEVHDRYTGIGEAQAIHTLTRLFDRMGVAMQVKRSQLLTWDEARDQNLIFIGGPDTNHPQRELPQLQQFSFKAVDEEPRPETGAVINLKPQTGEETYYFSSGPPHTFDYAVIGFVPGLDGRHRALILAGTTTYGTQGATEFLTNPASVKILRDRLQRGGSPGMPYFEALLRVKVSGGVPVQPELVLVRPRT